LHVSNWRESGRRSESPFEGAFGKLGALDHFLYRVGYREMRTQPLLRTLDLRIAMIAPALEGDVGRETVLVPLQRIHARHFLCIGGACITRDEIEHHVVPGHGSARGDQFFAWA
jgi:hypothetical protein